MQTIILSLNEKPILLSRESLGNYLRGISSVYFICLNKTLSVVLLKIEALLQEVAFSLDVFPIEGGELFLFPDENGLADKTQSNSTMSCLREIENRMPDFAKAIQERDNGTSWRHSVPHGLLEDFFQDLTE